MKPKPSFLYSVCKRLLLQVDAPRECENKKTDVKDDCKDNNDETSNRKKENQNLIINWKSIMQKGTFITIMTLIILWWRRRNKRNKKQPLSFFHPYKLFGHLRKNSVDKHNDYRNAIEAPLSVLLASARKGIIVKVLMNSNSISYKLQQSSTSNNDIESTMMTKWKKTILPKDNPAVMKEIINDIAEGGCLDISVLPDSLMSRLVPVFVTAFPFIYLLLLYQMLKRLQKGQSDGDDVGTFYKKDDLEERTTFSDVAGIDTAQVELQEIVSYLCNPKPFLCLGAKPPCGLLLHGRPGLGKTLLARAVAGEANADYFISCSGSDFVEIYVGQGAKRVRNLFEEARKKARQNWTRNKNNNALSFFRRTSCTGGRECVRPPTAVIFIDEIDSIAKCRDGIGRGLNGGIGGNDEREQTLNALLSELDGFKKSDVLVIVIAATNRVSMLDPAVLRPGRFDRHVAISPPDATGRRAILQIHSRNKRLDNDVDLELIAKDELTYNFTGAELQNVMNEAALLAVREGSETLCQNHLLLSIERIKLMKRYSTN